MFLCKHRYCIQDATIFKEAGLLKFNFFGVSSCSTDSEKSQTFI